MAKTVTKKTARKSATKGAVKGKTVAKKVAKKAAADRAAPFADDAKITVVTKENPRREGKEQHKRYAVILKNHGKTVEAFKAKGGDVLALRYAVNQGHAKVA